MPYKNLDEYRNLSKQVDIDGFALSYWQKGEKGIPVLFVHGFPSASWDWHHLWDSFEGSRRLVAMDLLGFGLSDKPFPHRYSLLQQADLIQALLRKLEIDTCHIVAHDYGNSVVQELLFRQSRNRLNFTIRSICFLNGGLFSESHRPLFTQKLLSSKLGHCVSKLLTKGALRKSFTKIFGKSTPPKNEEIDSLWQLLQHNDGQQTLSPLLAYIKERKVHRNGWVAAMQHTDIPLIFINGVQDPISGQHMVDRYKALIPNPKVIELPVGHYPQIEAPEVLADSVLEFISRVEN